jgi:hypothetical protein
MALLARKVALEVKGFTSRRAQQAGLSLVECTGSLRELRLESSGAQGSIDLLGSDVRLEDVTVRDAAAMAIFVRQGTVALSRVTIEGVRGEGGTLGDGLHLRDARVTADQVTVRDAEGSAVFAGAVASVELGRLESQRASFGALMVERRATVHAKDVVSSGSRTSAVTVIDGAQLILERLTVRGGVEVPVWAECGQGVSVQLGRVDAPTKQPPSPCVGPFDKADGGW